MSVTQVLAQPHAKKFFVARFISNYGNGMSPIALAFGILALPNGSANLLGLTLGITSAMFILMVPFGGVIADKYGRAKMVALTDTLAGLILFIQVFYFATGDVPVAVLLIVNGCYGILSGIFWPAFTGIMPSIVPEAGLQKANAINSLASNAGLILGAASAGILIDTYGAAITLGIDSASFVIAGVLVSTLSHLTPPMANNKNTMMKDFVDGWRVFKSFNWIVIVVVSFSFIVMCWAAAENVLGPLVALEHFNGAKSWSIVITAESAGLVVGALLAMRIKPKYPLVVSICAFFFGITLDLWGTLWYTALHRKVPRDALSRVSSFDAMGALVFKPIGLAIAAPISLLIGIDNLIYILIAISVLAISLPLLSADVRNMSYEDSPNN